MTEELVGKRIEYTYSPTERYEHIYLNGSFYTWHCLLGAEKGLADTDCCHSYKLARNLYLFVWREKIVPTLGVVVLDLNAMRTTGKIFGYEGNDFRKVVNFRIGARARLQNITPPRSQRLLHSRCDLNSSTRDVPGGRELGKLDGRNCNGVRFACAQWGRR